MPNPLIVDVDPDNPVTEIESLFNLIKLIVLL